ncbi:hypothetical protein ACUXAV_003783 [Cupriavidus metallidurans]
MPPRAPPPASPCEAIRAPLQELWARYRDPPTPPRAPRALPAAPRPRAAARSPAQGDRPLAGPPAPLPTVAPPLRPAIVAALHAGLDALLSESREPTILDARLALLRTLLGPDVDRLTTRADGVNGGGAPPAASGDA